MTETLYPFHGRIHSISTVHPDGGAIESIVILAGNTAYLWREEERARKADERIPRVRKGIFNRNFATAARDYWKVNSGKLKSLIRTLENGNF